MSGSLIFSTARQHLVRILYLFGSSPTSCPDPLSFRRFSGIMFRSPFLLDDSSASCPNPLSFQRLSDIMFESSIFFMVLWHRVRIPYLFYGSPASCSDPLAFWRLSGLVSESLIFFMALQHCVQIPYLFRGSPTSCSDPLVLNHSDPAPLAIGIIVQGQNCWPLISSIEFISTHSSLALCAHEPFVHSLY